MDSDTGIENGQEHIDSVLYDAVTKDNIHVLEECRLSVDKQLTANKSTVLHLACQYGSIKCVEHILRIHESVLFMRNLHGDTALHLAAREGHDQVVAALLDATKAKPLPLLRQINGEHETALHVAVRYNQKNVVQLLLNEDPSYSYPLHNPQDKHSGTPLYLASIRCYSDIIKAILENSESPEFWGPFGRTALHAALLDDGGHECVKLLLEKKKDLIKIADSYGWTAFHYVAYNDLHTIVEDLVVAGKSVGYKVDKCHGRTALHVAAYQGNIRVMKTLVEYYPDSWGMVDRDAKNILHIAVEQDQKEVIKFILSQGRQEMNNLLIQKDGEGNTPLHLVAKLGCYVQEFMHLKAELDWEVLNKKGLTPRDVLDSGQTGTLAAGQAMVRTILIQAKAKRHYLRLQDVEMPDMVETSHITKEQKNEEQTSHITKEQKNEEQRASKSSEEQSKAETSNMNFEVIENSNINFKVIEKTINTHIIVAALITTGALTAGFAMPGGFDGTEGKNQGSPMLLKKAAFKTFIITDAIALLLSVSSLFLYFWTILVRQLDTQFSATLFFISTILNLFSIVAMMLAFITGTYAVLAHSLALAVTVCIISSLFFLLLFYVLFKVVQKIFFFFIKNILELLFISILKSIGHPNPSSISQSIRLIND